MKYLDTNITSFGQELNVPKAQLVSTIENSLREHLQKYYDLVGVKVDLENESIDIIARFTVQEIVNNPYKEITIQKSPSSSLLGQTVEVKLEPKDLGRIGANNFKFFLLKSLRELKVSKYRDMVGQLVEGVARKFVGEDQDMLVDLEDGKAFVTNTERSEFFEFGKSKYFIVDQVDERSRVLLSRKSDSFIRAILPEFIKELNEGLVKIENIVRLPGLRTKVGVSSTVFGDPATVCTGLKGSNVKALKDELNGEQVDFYVWSNDMEKRFHNALKPVKPDSVNISAGVITLSVPDKDVGFVIGKKASNIRCLEKVIGCKITVSSSQVAPSQFDVQLGRAIFSLALDAGISLPIAAHVAAAGFTNMDAIKESTREEFSFAVKEVEKTELDRIWLSLQ